ncbi:hypothetical protein Ciccas_012104 [Cichlidogyrus casuarinus]|uniref:Selenoprotein O n=1 Tax=Cichlidogyrus casuarinus TaxID=1844966 RepID=A0ABD2PPT8_9PLAT
MKEIKNRSHFQETHHHANTHTRIGFPLVAGFILMFIIDQVRAIYRIFNLIYEKLNFLSPGKSEVDHYSAKAAFVTTFGLVIHSLADGIAVGSAFASKETTLKLIVFLAIILHKAPAAFGFTSYMRNSGQPITRIKLHLLIFCLSAPIASFITFFAISFSPAKSDAEISGRISQALLFSGGTFLYVAIAHVMLDLIRSGNHGSPQPTDVEDDSVTLTHVPEKAESKTDHFSLLECSRTRALITLDRLKRGPNFENLAVKYLPLDTVAANYIRQVSNAFYSKVQPTPMSVPQLVALSEDAFALLDLPSPDPHDVEQTSLLADYFSGNKIWPDSVPIAHCYCGHQFGYFAGQLGDGAAITLGDVRNDKGERWEIQLKGAGLTPYSRTADGRKVLRSSIREFLCSEAMHYLGVASTRALCLVTSDTRVARDPFYDGNVIMERATICTRLAPTFIRFGSFEIANLRDPQTGRSGPSPGKWALVDTLVNYVVQYFYPQIWTEFQCHNDRALMYCEFYREVVRRTARLLAHWQTIGFCHGYFHSYKIG